MVPSDCSLQKLHTMHAAVCGNIAWMHWSFSCVKCVTYLRAFTDINRDTVTRVPLSHVYTHISMDSQCSGEFFTEGVLDTSYLCHLLYHAIHWRVTAQLHTRTMGPAQRQPHEHKPTGHWPVELRIHGSLVRTVPVDYDCS